jgi:preprotein translocase subunit SecE
MDFTKLVNFLKDVKVEARKIDWPSRESTIRYSAIVIFICVVVAIYLGLLDFIFAALLNKFILFR